MLKLNMTHMVIIGADNIVTVSPQSHGKGRAHKSIQGIYYVQMLLLTVKKCALMVKPVSVR